MRNPILILLLFILTSLNGFSLKPVKEYLYKPDSLKLNFQEIVVSTKDKAKIKIWDIKPLVENENNSKTIIIAESDAGNMSYLLYQAYSLSYNGYSVILFDYRGFGESSDFEIDKNQLYYDEFLLDLKSVIKYSRKEYPKNEIGVLGFSMGAIIANIVSKKTKIDFLILEGIIPNLHRFVEKINNEKDRLFLLPKSAKKYDKRFYKNLKKVEKTLIFHGLKDKNSDTSKMPKNVVVTVFDGPHLGGFHKLTESYFGDQYIREFEKIV